MVTNYYCKEHGWRLQPFILKRAGGEHGPLRDLAWRSVMECPGPIGTYDREHLVPLFGTGKAEKGEITVQ